MAIMVIAAWLLPASQALAAEGALDPTFGTGGKVTTPIGTSDDFGRAVAVDAQGRIVVAGYTTTAPMHTDFALVRYNPNGSLDTSFGPAHTGIVTTPFTATAEANAVAIDSKGRIVAAGTVGPDNTATDDFAVARYLPNGNLDTSFNGSGKEVTDFAGDEDTASGIAIDSQDRVVVVGRVTDQSMNLVVGLARYRADNGKPDTTFGTAGKVTQALGTPPDEVQAAAIDSRGRIYVVGSRDAPAYDRLVVGRFTPAGHLDTSFASPNGYAATPLGDPGKEAIANAVTIDAKDRPVVAGQAIVGAVQTFALARYTTTGTLDTSFNHTGIVTTPFGSTARATGVAIDQQGRIVAAGEGKPGSTQDFAVARYEPNGSLDSTFGTGGTVTTPFGSADESASAVAIDARDRVVAAGSGFNGSNDDIDVARYIGDQTRPSLTIGSGPKDGTFTNDPTPTFTLESDDPLAKFTCAVDAGPASACPALYTAGPLADGRHTVTFTATDPALNSTSASRTFTVDTKKPRLRIKGKTRIATRRRKVRAHFRLKTNEPVTFHCRIDRRKAKPCESRYRTPKLKPGGHRLTVRATDRGKNATVKMKKLEIVRR